MTLKFWQLSRPSLTMGALPFLSFLFIVMPNLVGAQSLPVTFATPTTFATAPCCWSTEAVATGDFNGDGKLDIVNIDSGSNLNVMLGNGNGTFQTPISTNIAAAGIFYRAIAVGDFNGDHLLDVAIWTNNANVQPNGITQVNVYLGNGNGTFTAGGTFQAPNTDDTNPGPNSIVAADVNGDGKLDLLTVTDFNGVFVFLGNGDGTFQTAAHYSPGTSGGCCDAISVGDLNGDGKPDLAVAIANGISILLNQGNGTFATGTYYPSGVAGDFSGDGIAIGDLNGDKKPDVVVTEENGGYIIFLNQGSGVFKETGVVSGPAVGATNNILLADINNDKKLDVVIPDAFGDVYTFFGKGNGTFTVGPAYPLQEANNSGVYAVAVGDFNGDGTLDLFDANGLDTSTVALGRGDGSFQQAQLTTFAGNVQSQVIAVADFNGDGFPDVVSQGPAKPIIDVLLGSSHGALSTKPISTTVSSCANNYVYFIAAGDVTGDGKADVVATMADATFPGCQNHTVAVLTGAGTGHFSAAKYYATGATGQEYQIYLVDVNGDGKLDIVTSNLDGTISVLLNNGKGTYGAPKLISSIASLSAYDNQLAFGDFNGDGKMDIAVSPDSLVTNDTSIHVLPGNGDGTFGSPITTSIGYYQHSVAVGDFNGDGKMDLIVTTTANGCTLTGAQSGYLYLQGKGDGTFTPGMQECGFYAAPYAPVVADLNGDGKLDVVIPFAAGTDSTAVGPEILQGNGDGTFTSSQAFYSGRAVNSAAVADFNGDGMPDVALGDYTSFIDVMLNATKPVSVSPLTLNYGSVTVASKKAETVILTNDQSTSLAISSIALGGVDPGDFKETNNCSTSRKAGWDCTITVTFTPTVTGTRSATLTIKDGAGTQTVQLNGTGK